MQGSNVKAIFAISGSSLVLVGCVANQAQVTMLQAPEVAQASAFKSMAVARFSGQNGDSLSVAMENAMMNARIQEKPVYRSVSRAPEGRSTASDSRSLASAARAQGADAILWGEVTQAGVQDQRSTTTNFVCDQGANPKKLVSKCVSGHNETVACIERSASMQVQVRLIDAKTGNAVYSQAISKQEVSQGCGSNSPKDGRAMLGSLQAAVVDEVMRKIVPHDKNMSVSLMDADDRIRSPANKERFAGAIKFANSGRMDRACEMMREVYEQEKDSVALNYDLGVCEEAAGAFWKASEHYRIADRLTNEPNKLITAALSRNDQNIKKAGAMANIRSDLVKSDRLEAGASPQMIKKGNSRPSASQPIPSAPQNISSEALFLGQRTALVIGNSKYRRGALLNPANDARAMAAELRKSGFQVIAIEDAGLNRMNSAIEEFGRSIKRGGVALVFYAGHGMQVNGENYLIPVDADLTKETDIQSKTLNLGLILTKLEDAKSRVNVVVLDACRDNPFARSWRSAGKGGLATIDAPAGTVIAFATAPGKTAADGSGANGLFTTHFLAQLRIPNQKLEDVLKNTRKGVAADSQNEQIPWDSSSLTGDFYFKVSSNVMAANPAVSGTPATAGAESTTLATRSIKVDGKADSTEKAAPDTARSANPENGLLNSLKGLFKPQD
jgi:uncharacterized caspase-like protein